MNQKNDLFSKFLNPVIVVLWRLGLGRLVNILPSLTGRIMILKHNGRKSGNSIFTPMNYIEHDGLILCAACLGESSDWYLNIMANPQVEVWLPGGWYAGQGDVIEQPDEQLELLRTVLSSGNIAARITGIDLDLDDEDFAVVAQDYKLIRIARQSPLTGVNGPAGLAWLWPFILVILLGIRPRRRR